MYLVVFIHGDGPSLFPFVDLVSSAHLLLIWRIDGLHRSMGYIYFYIF